MKRLEEKLDAIGNTNYGHYKRLKGRYSFVDFHFELEHIQGDPFASPSLGAVSIPISATGFPDEWLADKNGQVPLGDFLTRQLWAHFQGMPKLTGSGNSGYFGIPCPGQQILQRSSVVFTPKNMYVRFRLGLPAEGRRIHSESAREMLFGLMPGFVGQFCFYNKAHHEALETHIRLYRRQMALRKQIREAGLIAFVPDGAILPRASGQSDKPLNSKNTVPFKSPESMRVSFKVDASLTLQGMGVRPGVHLIVGGGFHGKSTLLRALETGVYNHIQGDGREYICTSEENIKIRSENGRAITGVDLSAFINRLPFEQETRSFSTLNASGSTSQAASISEAIEAGAEVLLMDEDTCASNFMIRDEKMRRLIADEDEPITPFLFRVRQLFESCGVSTFLVMGGSGDYFSSADTVIGMKNFSPHDLSQTAKQIAFDIGGDGLPKAPHAQSFFVPRVFQLRLPNNPRAGAKIKVRNTDTLRIGDWFVETKAIEQLVCREQLNLIGYLLKALAQKNMELNRNQLEKVVSETMSYFFTHLADIREDFAEVRYLDLMSVINRLPQLQVVSVSEKNENSDSKV